MRTPAHGIRQSSNLLQMAAVSRLWPCRIDLPLEIPDRFAAVHRADGLPERERNIVRHIPHGAVAETHVDAVGMPAAGRLVMVGGRGAGHLDFGPGDAETGQ